jgi:hypothetical protein
MSELLIDRAGRRRPPATMPGFHAGHAPVNNGLRYPADPPKVEGIVAVMRAAGDRAHGGRLRGLIATARNSSTGLTESRFARRPDQFSMWQIPVLVGGAAVLRAAAAVARLVARDGSRGR